jgi:hypothetical protein
VNIRFTKTAIFRMSAVLARIMSGRTHGIGRPPSLRVRVACALYKLVQGTSLLQCSEFFCTRKVDSVGGAMRCRLYCKQGILT